MCYKLRIIILCLLASGVTAASGGSTASDIPSDDQQLNLLADEYLNFLYQEMPEWTTELNLKNARNDLFNDHSLKSTEKLRAFQVQLYSNILNIDISKLSEEARITYYTIRDNLEGVQATQICKKELWNLDSYYPWFAALANLAELQPVATEKDRVDAVSRWMQFDKVVDAEIEKLKIGVQQGYTAPKIVLSGIIEQLKSLLNLPIKQSPFYIANNGTTTPEFEQQFQQIVSEIVYPSLNKFKEYMIKEYLPRARLHLGVSS